MGGLPTTSRLHNGRRWPGKGPARSSFLLTFPDATSRTRAPSLGWTSSTRSPADSSCWASRWPSPHPDHHRRHEEYLPDAGRGTGYPWRAYLIPEKELTHVRASFEPRHRRGPGAGHVVRKPGRYPEGARAGRRLESQDNRGVTVNATTGLYLQPRSKTAGLITPGHRNVRPQAEPEQLSTGLMAALQGLPPRQHSSQCPAPWRSHWTSPSSTSGRS